MTVSTWTGGTHRITDPGAWTPSVPVSSGDTGVITAGHALAVNQTVGPYAINLYGADAGEATLDAVGSTFTGFVGGMYMTNTDPTPPNADGTIGLLGKNTNDGTLGTTSNYNESDVFPNLNIKLADVASPTAVIEQAVLINDGTMSSAESSPVTISGSTDALLINNGTIAAGGNFDIGVAVTGTGTIGKTAAPREQGSVLTFESAVSAGQTLTLSAGEVAVKDPLNFRATVLFSDADQGFVDLQTAATSASYIDGTLSVFDGTDLVSQFNFGGNITASDILLEEDANGGTQIRDSFGFSASPIPVATTGTVPVAPPIVLPGSVATLPRSGSDITDSQDALVASNEKLGGYTIDFTNGSNTTQASLSISSVTLGLHFVVSVGGSGSSQSYGDLYAVGNNLNAGSIEAANASTLNVALSDAVGPDGVTLIAGKFTNSGEILAQTGGTISITGMSDSKLINSGTIADGGMMFVGPAVAGAGSVTIGGQTGAAGSLEFGGSVGAGQNVDFLAGTLTLDDAKDFHATVFDFDATDEIVLKGVDVSSLAYGNGVLKLDGGTDGALKIASPDSGAFHTRSFALTHSAQDSIITLVTRPADEAFRPHL